MTDIQTYPEHIPFLWRILAWWEGYDPLEYARMRRPRKRRRSVIQALPAPEQHSPTEARLDLIQKIWGKGLSDPGGPDYINELSKQLSLSPQMSALVVGAGLGGLARKLVQDYGVWINGYESDPVVAEIAQKISVDEGLARKAIISQMNLDDSPIFERKFDRAFSKDTLYKVTHKKDLLKAVHKQLKKSSLFLLTDYVAKDQKSINHPEMVQWQINEPDDIVLCDSSSLRNLLEEVGFQVRVQEDVSTTYIKMIEQAWAQTNELVLELAEDKEANRDSLNIILKEAEIWDMRARALQSGRLRVYRYLAYKPTSF
tara:strand:+ start:2051 stop:2992 length:942 start_codon:yes stop_codon:yes gene_type:complete